MDIQNFIAEFKKTFIYDMLCESLEDEQLFEHSIVGDKVVWFKVQTSQMWSMWQAAQADAVNQPDQMTISFDRFEELINKAVDAVSKTVAVPEGFVLVSKDRLVKAVDGIEALLEEDSLLALGELLPIQQDLSAMIEAQEQGHE